MHVMSIIDSVLLDLLGSFSGGGGRFQCETAPSLGILVCYV